MINELVTTLEHLDKARQALYPAVVDLYMPANQIDKSYERIGEMILNLRAVLNAATQDAPRIERRIEQVCHL
jgi:hypothetical protein